MWRLFFYVGIPVTFYSRVTEDANAGDWASPCLGRGPWHDCGAILLQQYPRDCETYHRCVLSDDALRTSACALIYTHGLSFGVSVYTLPRDKSSLPRPTICSYPAPRSGTKTHNLLLELPLGCKHLTGNVHAVTVIPDMAGITHSHHAPIDACAHHKSFSYGKKKKEKNAFLPT